MIKHGLYAAITQNSKQEPRAPRIGGKILPKLALRGKALQQDGSDPVVSVPGQGGAIPNFSQEEEKEEGFDLGISNFRTSDLPVNYLRYETRERFTIQSGWFIGHVRSREAGRCA